MRCHLFVFLFIMCGLWPLAGQAQDQYWIQISNKPTLAMAQADARRFARNFDNVAGFDTGSAWYAVALGPFTREQASDQLRLLRSKKLIPATSFVTDNARFGRRFWPAGVTANTPEPTSDTQTLQDAQAAERALSLDEKKQIQRALAWAGFYNSAIDGLFGRGTRASIQSWQTSQGFDPTGVLADTQRAALMADYNRIFDGLGMEAVSDDRAGIKIDLPAGVLNPPQYDAPLVTFTGRDDPLKQVILISGAGDRNSLTALYDILQTLEVMPPDGPRDLGRSVFDITGQNDRYNSTITARLEGGIIKGFGLIWPAGDDTRRERLLERMQQSFERTQGVLSDTPLQVPKDASALAGLDIRVPKFSRSGFFIDMTGTVITAAANVAACDYVTINSDHRAEVIFRTDDYAVLRAMDQIVPQNYARIASVPAPKSRVAVSGFSFGGVLDLPTLTFGTLSALEGLHQQADVMRLDLSFITDNIGGPVFDETGAVNGEALPHEMSGQILPDNVSTALQSDVLQLDTLTRADDDRTAKTPVALSRSAAEITALVSCW